MRTLLVGMLWAGIAHGASLPFLSDFGADPTGARDSTASIQAAIAKGGIVYADRGTYRISNTLIWQPGAVLIGNGTVNIPGYGPTNASVTLQWTGVPGGIMIEVSHLSGWSIQNVRLEGSGTAHIGILVNSSLAGDCRNLAIQNVDTGILSQTDGTTNSMHNGWTNIWIVSKQTSILLGGNTLDTDTCCNSFENLWLLCGNGYPALLLQWADSNVFKNVQAFGPVKFDSTGPSEPTSNMFYAIDCQGWIAAGPGPWTTPNYVYAMFRSNGTPLPNIPAVICVTPDKPYATQDDLAILQQMIVNIGNIVAADIYGIVQFVLGFRR